jgi:multiple sugar transport system substrate-binding protein
LWTWSVVINARTRDLDAAWRFVEWASGPDFLRRSAFEGNMNPTRLSTWEDDEFRERAGAWGSFYDVARRLVEHEASVLVTPAANYREVATRWVAAIRDAYAGRVPLPDALAAAATDIDSLTSLEVAT